MKIFKSIINLFLDQRYKFKLFEDLFIKMTAVNFSIVICDLLLNDFLKNLFQLNLAFLPYYVSSAFVFNKNKGMKLIIDLVTILISLSAIMYIEIFNNTDLIYSIALSLILINILLRELRYLVKDLVKAQCSVIYIGRRSKEANILMIALNSSDKYTEHALYTDPDFVHIPEKQRLSRNNFSNLLSTFRSRSTRVVFDREVTKREEFRDIERMLMKKSIKYDFFNTQTNDDSLSLDSNQLDKLLGREKIDFSEYPSVRLAEETVLVTGAAGSIGSELVRQLLWAKPYKVIACDISEYELYKLEEELQASRSSTEIFYVLGDVADVEFIDQLFEQYTFHRVFHAAAYKHVPLVERNIVHATLKNIQGALCVAEACSKKNVNKVTLVSTDKAVRPTNFMGASKRVCELIFQAFNHDTPNTKFSIVRFGNVLGSSGSVIPKFENQIKQGGPLTITHADITRYFMSIREAVGLVLVSSELSQGGEVFVLDMGLPVKLHELAKKMLNLFGYFERSTPNVFSYSDGKVEREKKIKIVFSGLRPGEKLYEELLIDIDKMPKKVGKIFQAEEKFVETQELLDVITNLNLYRREKKFDQYVNTLLSLPLDYTKAMENPILEHNSTTHNTAGVNYKAPSKRESSNIFFRLFLVCLHKYFLLTRPVTLGARTIILSPDDKVLLVKQSYTDTWHLPGGGVDPGEDILNAAQREVLEETGIELDDRPRLLNMYHNSESSKRDYVAVYHSRVWSSDLPKFSSKEISKIEFFETREAYNLLPEYEKASLAEYVRLHGLEI